MAGANTPAVGIDFGTTNSSVALAGGDGTVRFVTFAAAAGLSPSSRSLLYLQRHSAEPGKPVHVWSGPEAIARYLQHDPYDDSVQGRLIQSLKSYVALRSFTGTEIFGRRYRVEDLLAKMLGDLRLRASEAFGFEVTRAVAGRPVWFVHAASEDDNTFAEQRLHAAFLQAGWKDVRFALEPVAAAHSYVAVTAHGAESGPRAAKVSSASANAAVEGELLLVGDFGGGTTDFSLLRLGRQGERPTVVGSTGVGLAGDAFDARIVRHAVAPAFGYGSLERTPQGAATKAIPALPAWVYTSLERWHLLSFLQTRQTTELLRTAEMRAAEPAKIAALRLLVERDLGYRLHGAVQSAKVALSSENRAVLVFREEGLNLCIEITRSELEPWIAPELRRIQESLHALLAEAAVDEHAVRHVLLTGGTSQVPAVRRVFTERFSRARLKKAEAFTSVAYGLARMAAQEFH